MIKEKSIGITVFGLLEILIGILGSFALMLSIHSFASSLQSEWLPRIIGVGIATSLIKTTFASPALIVAGIGVLKLSTWARKINIFVIPLLLSISLILLLLELLEGLYVNINILLFILFVAISPIYFFTRPKVKEQFK